jgi:hypothetical protein
MTPEKAATLRNYFITANRGWDVKIEGNKVRVFVKAFIVDWQSFREVEKACNLEVYDVIAHAQLGVVVSLLDKEGS